MTNEVPKSVLLMAVFLYGQVGDNSLKSTWNSLNYSQKFFAFHRTHQLKKQLEEEAS